MSAGRNYICLTHQKEIVYLQYTWGKLLTAPDVLPDMLGSIEGLI